MPNLENRSAILVDDGLASGFTLRASVAALRNAGASAYQYWWDVAEGYVVKLLEQFKTKDL